MVLDHPIKTLGLTQVRVVLHPEVSISITANVARSPEEAAKQARGERVTGAAEAETETVSTEDLLEPGTEQPT